MRVLACLLILACVGCNSSALGNGSPGDDALPQQDQYGGADLATPPDLIALPPATITGYRRVTYVTEKQEETRIGTSLVNTPVEALVPDGHGGFTSYPGAGTDQASFMIPNVPAGLRYVHYDNWLYFYTSATTVDLGYDVVGRYTAKNAVQPETALVFNVTGLDPWKAGDGTEFYSVNAGAQLYCVQCNSVNPPVAGDVALNGLQTSYLNGASPVLIDGTQGDVAALYQFDAAVSSGGASYSALAQVATFPPFVQQDGAVTTLNGAFVPVPQDQSLTLGTWRSSAFAALRASANPLAMTGSQFLAIRTQPFGLDNGVLFQGVDLVATNGGGLDSAIGQVQFGNPFSPHGNPFLEPWGIYGVASVSFPVSYALPALKPVAVKAESWIEVEVNAFAASPTIEPGISPAQHPLLNGQDAFTRQTVSLPVVVAWSPPALGTATIYHLYFYQLINQQGTTAANYVAALHTAEATELTIPTGVLMSGQSYCIALYAEHVAGINGASSPFRRAFPRSGASLLTAMFTVQ